MAEKETSKRQTNAGAEAPKNDIQALLSSVREHPFAYIAGVLFILAVLIAAGLYNLAQRTSHREVSSEYARALDKEDPADRAEALGPVAKANGYLAPEALYLQGAAYLEAGNYDAAQDTFRELRESHPDFKFVPDAVEGLGFIKEDQDDYTGARTIYEEVAQKWPDSFAAQRQPFNIGRCYENEGDLEAAIAQYRRQLEIFPGSTIAARAQQRLNDLRAEHPEMFETETTETTEAPAIQELNPAPPESAAPEPPTEDEAETEAPPTPDVEATNP